MIINLILGNETTKRKPCQQFFIHCSLGVCAYDCAELRQNGIAAWEAQNDYNVNKLSIRHDNKMLRDFTKIIKVIFQIEIIHETRSLILWPVITAIINPKSVLMFFR